MTNAQFIFNTLTKQDMINVVAFMEENKEATLAAAINWLFEIIYIEGEMSIGVREHDVDYAVHIRQCRLDIYAYYGWDNDSDIEIPF